MKETIYNWGINDIPKSDGKKYYTTWKNMIMRVYYKPYIISHPTYNNTKIHKDWKYLSKFKEWFDIQYIEGYSLDKDIFIPNNKIYNPDNCTFVPHHVNQLISRKNGKGYTKTTSNKYRAAISINGKIISIGVYTTKEKAHNAYKQTKANHFMSIADEYKNINDKIYIGLYRHASILENGFYDF